MYQVLSNLPSSYAVMDEEEMCYTDMFLEV